MAKPVLEGFDELNAGFQEISKAARRGVLKRAVVKAAKPLAQKMSDLAPYDEGDLTESPIIEGDVEGGIAGKRAYARAKADGASNTEARNALRAANKANAGQYRVNAAIGPAKAKAPHAHLVEFGTGPRHHKNGKFVGVMPADPFVRPAWDMEGGMTAQARIADHLREELAKSVARARRKAAKA